MSRRESRRSFASVLPLCLLPAGCSNSSPPSADPACDSDGGARPQGGFCIVAEVSPESDAAAPQGVSFSRDVQPILTHYCGVVGCHVSGSPTGGLNLAPGFAFDQLVDAQPPEIQALPDDGGAVYYVAPGDLDHSYLHIKIHPDLFMVLKNTVPTAAQGRLGTEMPAKSTGSVLDQNTQVGVIDQWIQTGAPQN
jgi:hypothetical protein